MNLEDTITSYRPSEATCALVRSADLLLLAGVVGGGKNTVINELIKDESYHLILSHTSREPRENHGIAESDGVDYHFVSLEKMEQLLREQAFIEAKYVHGNVYGTSTSELEQAMHAHKTAVTDIDVQGVMEYLAIKPAMHAIFLLPPSVDTWLKRLERRYGNLEVHKAEINKRFKTALEEIKHIQQDKRFVIVINDDLATTVERIEAIRAGRVKRTSDYAEVVTEHLLDYLETVI